MFIGLRKKDAYEYAITCKNIKRLNFELMLKVMVEKYKIVLQDNDSNNRSRKGDTMLQEGLRKLEEYAYNEHEEDLQEALECLRDVSSSFLPPTASQELSELIEEIETYEDNGTLESFIHELVDRLDIIVKEL